MNRLHRAYEPMQKKSGKFSEHFVLVHNHLVPIQKVFGNLEVVHIHLEPIQKISWNLVLIHKCLCTDTKFTDVVLFTLLF
jgi:hypothetical protein